MSLDYKKAAITAGVAVGGSLLLGVSFSDNVSLGPVDVPAPIAIAAVSGAATLLTDWLASMPNVTNNQWIQMLKSYMKPVLTGVSTLALSFLLINNEVNYMAFVEYFGLGFVSELVGQYVVDGMHTDPSKPDTKPNPDKPKDSIGRGTTRFNF